MSRRRSLRAALAAVALMGLTLPGVVPLPAYALDPEERLPDAAQEARAREISKQLRCLVCKGQTIDDSNAPIARALRGLVRERIAAGDDDEAVLAAVTSRYGESVRLAPRLTADSLLLWAGPFLVLLIGGVAAVGFVRRSAVEAGTAPLTEEERARLSRAFEDR